MVSAGVVALCLAAFAQAAYGGVVRYEEGCCPGEVIEKKYVVQRPVQETYTYQTPVYSKKCYTKSGGIDKQVIPRSFETGPVCHTQETVVKVPTTDVEVQETPLCKKTCTTSQYVLQIPIKDVTCVSRPMCKKTVRSQDNVMTTVSKKTSCSKQHCTQNTVVEKPVIQTVCQDYEQSVNKVGTKTVFKPEVKKYCVQLPPRRCVKPVYGYSSANAYADATSVTGSDSGSYYTSGSQSGAHADASSFSGSDSGSYYTSGSQSGAHADASSFSGSDSGSYYTSGSQSGAQADASSFAGSDSGSYYTSGSQSGANADASSFSGSDSGSYYTSGSCSGANAGYDSGYSGAHAGADAYSVSPSYSSCNCA